MVLKVQPSQSLAPAGEGGVQQAAADQHGQAVSSAVVSVCVLCRKHATQHMLYAHSTVHAFSSILSVSTAVSQLVRQRMCMDVRHTSGYPSS